MSHQAEQAGGRRNERTKGRLVWSGILAFAAMLMMFNGSVHVLTGLIAAFEDGQFQVGNSDLIVTVDYTVWGVVHGAIGVTMILAGWGLFFRRTWARIATVIIAFVSSLINWAFLPSFPAWYALMIGVDLLIIYAVTVHGDEGGWEES